MCYICFTLYCVLKKICVRAEGENFGLKVIAFHNSINNFGVSNVKILIFMLFTFIEKNFPFNVKFFPGSNEGTQPYCDKSPMMVVKHTIMTRFLQNNT